MRRPHVAPVALCLLAALSVWAGSAAAQTCADAEGPRELQSCFAGELRRANRDLDLYYGECLRQAEDRAALRAALVRSQEAWLRYRDADCRALHEAQPVADDADLQRVICELRDTRRRTQDLWGGFLSRAPTPLVRPGP